MSLFTYQTGDCGIGYFKSIIMVCVMVLLAWLPNAIVMLSWIQSGGAGLVFIPMVYNNAFIIPSWILGTLSLIPGLLAAYSASSAKRTVMLNVWVVATGIFAVAIAAAGIYLVHFIATDKDILDASVNEFGRYAAKKAGVPTPKPGSNLQKAGDRASEYLKAVGAYTMYKILPYPLSAFYFLHWQVGVTAVAFAVIPALLGIWATYHALGNRNFFATNPEAYKDQRISDGPLFTDETSDNEDLSDSEESSVSEREPLSKRHSDFGSHVNSESVRNNSKGKVVAGRKFV